MKKRIHFVMYEEAGMKIIIKYRASIGIPHDAVALYCELKRAKKNGKKIKNIYLTTQVK